MTKKIPFRETIYYDVGKEMEIARYSYLTKDGKTMREVQVEIRPNRLRDDEKQVGISALKNDVEINKIPHEDIVEIELRPDFESGVKSKIIYV